MKQGEQPICDVPSSKSKKSVKGRKRSNSRDDSITCAKSLVNESVADHLPIRRMSINVRDGHLGMTLCNHPLGVLVSEAFESDKAWSAGLRKGDVLISVNGEPVTSHKQCAKVMFEEAILSLEYYGATECERFLFKRRRPSKIAAFEPKDGHLGLTISAHPLGLLVLDADPCDKAHTAGLRVGDVVVTINGEAVTDHHRAIQIIDWCAQHNQRIKLTYHKAEAAAIELILTATDYVSFQHGCSISSYTNRTNRSDDSLRPSNRVRMTFKEQQRVAFQTEDTVLPPDRPIENSYFRDRGSPPAEQSSQEVGLAVSTEGKGESLIAEVASEIRGETEPPAKDENQPATPVPASSGLVQHRRPKDQVITGVMSSRGTRFSSTSSTRAKPNSAAERAAASNAADPSKAERVAKAMELMRDPTTALAKSDALEAEAAMGAIHAALDNGSFERREITEMFNTSPGSQKSIAERAAAFGSLPLPDPPALQASMPLPDAVPGEWSGSFGKA